MIVWNGLNKPAERRDETSREEKSITIETTDGAKAAIQRLNLFLELVIFECNSLLYRYKHHMLIVNILIS